MSGRALESIPKTIPASEASLSGGLGGRKAPRLWAVSLGCGNQPYEGYIGLDWSGYAADIRGDLPHLPFRDNSITEFFASHVVEHIPYWQVRDVLREVYRALKPRDGLFWGYVPDAVGIIEGWIKAREENDIGATESWLGNIYGGNTTSKWSGPGQIHYCLYDIGLLTDVLQAGGFHPVVVGRQGLSKFDQRLVFACGKGLYPTGNIWGTMGYPNVPWRKPIWELPNSPVSAPPKGALQQ